MICHYDKLFFTPLLVIYHYIKEVSTHFYADRGISRLKDYGTIKINLAKLIEESGLNYLILIFD